MISVEKLWGKYYNVGMKKNSWNMIVTNNLFLTKYDLSPLLLNLRVAPPKYQWKYQMLWLSLDLVHEVL